MLKIRRTAIQLAALDEHLRKIPRPPGCVAIPFSFASEPRNEDGSLCFTSVPPSNETHDVEILSDGETVAWGLIRGIQKPGEFPWDVMVVRFFSFNPKNFYVWVETTRDGFTGKQLAGISEILSVTDLVLKAVISPGIKTNEGILIEAVTATWFDIIDVLKKDPSIAFKIPPHKWEEIIAGIYSKSGFDEVTLTPRSGDLGRDVSAVKRGVGSIRVIDQVKAYKPGHLVTADDVRALFGVVQLDGASKGFLTTTSDFAPRLKDDLLLKQVIPSRLELINGTELLKRLNELARPKQ